jgi:hypothetical protein
MSTISHAKDLQDSIMFLLPVTQITPHREVGGLYSSLLLYLYGDGCNGGATD